MATDKKMNSCPFRPDYDSGGLFNAETRSLYCPDGRYSIQEVGLFLDMIGFDGDEIPIATGPFDLGAFKLVREDGKWICRDHANMRCHPCW